MSPDDQLRLRTLARAHSTLRQLEYDEEIRARVRAFQGLMLAHDLGRDGQRGERRYWRE